MDIKDIKTIIELMKRNDLTHFELEREGEKLVLKKNIDPETLNCLLGNMRAATPAPTPIPAPAAATPVAVPPPHDAEASDTSVEPADGITIKSPMVGTFYRSSGPGQELFVKIGDYVEADTLSLIHI